MKIFNNQFGLLSLIIISLFFYLSFERLCANKKSDSKNQLKNRISDIDLATFIILRKNPRLVCVDIREEKFYNYAHIPGAYNIPLDNFLEVAQKQKIIKFNESIDLIFYSNSQNSNSLESIIEFLNKQKVEKVKFYKGGWSEWKACEMPVEGKHCE